MKEEIQSILEDALPLVDFDSDFLFAELTSLDVAHMLIILGDKYGVQLGAKDVTPKNFKNLDAIVKMVQDKMQ